MHFKSIHFFSQWLPLTLLMSILACAPATSKSIVKVRVQEPERGEELCYFNETPSYIGVDFERGVIEVCPEKKIIFYPPTSCDSARPHQVRWEIRCLNGEENCMEKGDLVIIRPKERRVDGDGHKRARQEDERDCKPAVEVANESLCTHQKSPIELAMPTETERNSSFKQRHTMFNSESKGLFVIPHTAKTVASGIPNPNFRRGVSLGWYYDIELQRDGKTLACVDPDIWIERENG